MLRLTLARNFPGSRTPNYSFYCGVILAHSVAGYALRWEQRVLRNPKQRRNRFSILHLVTWPPIKTTRPHLCVATGATAVSNAMPPFTIHPLRQDDHTESGIIDQTHHAFSTRPPRKTLFRIIRAMPTCVQTGPTPSASKKPPPPQRQKPTAPTLHTRKRFPPPYSCALESTLCQRGRPRNSPEK